MRMCAINNFTVLPADYGLFSVSKLERSYTILMRSVKTLWGRQLLDEVVPLFYEVGQLLIILPQQGSPHIITERDAVQVLYTTLPSWKKMFSLPTKQFPD